MQRWRPEPRLRQKKEVNLNLSDKEIFQSMPLGDVWQDANLIEVYRYLRKFKKNVVPQSWESVFDDLNAELEKLYPIQSAPEAQWNDLKTIFLNKNDENYIPQKSANIHQKYANFRKNTQTWISALCAFWIIRLFDGLPCKRLANFSTPRKVGQWVTLFNLKLSDPCLHKTLYTILYTLNFPKQFVGEKWQLVTCFWTSFCRCGNPAMVMLLGGSSEGKLLGPPPSWNQGVPLTEVFQLCWNNKIRWASMRKVPLKLLWRPGTLNSFCFENWMWMNQTKRFWIESYRHLGKGITNQLLVT